MPLITKTFSVKNGLDVANTIIVDSNRNISNVVGMNASTVNVTTANAQTFITSAGLNVTNQANNAYAQANSAISQANNAYAQANAAYAEANLRVSSISVSGNGLAVSNVFSQNLQEYSISVNSASTTLRGTTLLIDTINSTDSSNAATANAVKTAWDYANTKLALTGGTINGSLNISGNLVLTGNTTFINANSYVVNDPLIFLASNNDISDVVDIGFVGAKNTGSGVTHTGLARDAGDATWYLFDNLADSGHQNNVIDFANTTLATLRANISANSILLGGTTVATQANLTIAHNQANAAYGQANLAYAQANAARSQANSAYAQANAAYNEANSKFNIVGGTITGNVTITGDILVEGNNAVLNVGSVKTENTIIMNSGYVGNNPELQPDSGNAYIVVNRGGGTRANAMIFYDENAVQWKYYDGNPIGTEGYIAFDTMQLAYGQANTAYSQANAAANTVHVKVTNQPNGVSTAEFSSHKLQLQNTSTVQIDVGTVAYVDGNYANVRFHVLGLNTAYDQANTAYAQANAAYAQANDAYNQANIARTTGNNAYAQANTARDTANDAYGQANTARDAANAAYAQANNAYGQANLAYTQANNAYAKANSPITVKEIYASNSTVVNTYTNINTLQFDSDSGMAVVNAASNTVTIQLNSTFKNWLMNGNTGLVATGLDTVNFIGNGITIEANNNASPKTITFTSTGGGGGGGTSIVESDVFSANGVQTTFGLTRSTTTDKAFVYISGVAQVPQVDYQVSGTNLTFNTAPLNGTTIEVRSLIDLSIANVSSFITDQFTANGVQNTFTLSASAYSSNGVFVFVDGISQVPTVDYTVSGTTLTFTNPPESNGIVEVRSVIGIQIPDPSLSNNSTVLQLTANGQYSFTAGGFVNGSDSISRTYILRGTTTGNTETEIFLDSVNNRIPVSTNTTVFYSADIVARRTDVTGESAGYQIKGVADNFSGTVADVGSLYELVVAEDDAAMIVDARADDTNNSINFYVTGSTGKTIRWTALVRTTEVAQ